VDNSVLDIEFQEEQVRDFGKAKRSGFHESIFRHTGYRIFQYNDHFLQKLTRTEKSTFRLIPKDADSFTFRKPVDIFPGVEIGVGHPCR